MDQKTAHILDQLTADFYHQQARSFSNSRRSAWRGWKTCLPYIQQLVEAGEKHGEDPSATRLKDERENHPAPVTVGDVGCGNLRFEEFLANALPEADFAFSCYDLEPSFPSVAWGDADLSNRVQFYQFDIVKALEQETALSAFPPEAFQLTVCFGVFHHIARQELRGKLFRSLVDATRSGGLCLISFWCFLDNKKMSRKANEWHEQARHDLPQIDFTQLGPHDKVLGWKSFDAWRYAHSFTEEEVRALYRQVRSQAKVLTTFRADGKDNDQNIYLVLQKR